MKVREKVVQTKKGTPEWSFPDAVSMAESIVTNSMDFCARKMRLSNTDAVVEQLQEREAAACNYCQYSVAKEVGEALGSLDKNVRSAYMLDYDATPQDLAFAVEKRGVMIHLIVWVERKTNALNSIVASLDRALAQDFAKLLNMEKLEHLLDVQVVDDSDVENRTGYGAMLSSLYQRPLQVWKR